MEIGATLHHLCLHSGDPDACARFYARTYAMTLRVDGEHRICTGPGRRLVFARGASNELGYAAFAFPSAAALASYRAAIGGAVDLKPSPSPLFDAGAFMAVDPDGNRIVFGAAAASNAADEAGLPEARLQHLAVRSADAARLRGFYRDALKFVVSDSVHDDARQLKACFLRTDREHHALAVFQADGRRHDHLSFETRDWAAMREWADRITSGGAPIVWGIGRHGPGNDTFFMVRDPDGNLAEISAELEVCDPARPEGEWRHEPRTLNLWGSAIMRS